MNRFIILFFLFAPVLALAQRPGSSSGTSHGITGTVSGILLDSFSNEPIEYAAIGIVDPVTGSVINGGMSDSKGGFKISDLPLGEYRIQASFIGYATKKVPDIRLTPRHPDFDCDYIFLTQESLLLDEIRVVGEVALIEAKADKIVYNAEHDVTSRGGDAADVLRKVPLLAVDFDGNVSMRGSGNVRILINGRPSGMFNSNVADALKMMPADQIKSVEVITSPSARYDGEGTAGIINIITKKKNIEGLAGSVDLTGGTRSNRGNMSLNYGKGRFGANFSGGGHYSWPQSGKTAFNREDFGSALPTLLVQNGTNKSSRLGYRTNGGMEYNFNAYNSINSSVSVRGWDSDSYNDVISDYVVNGELVDSYQRTVDRFSGRSGLDWDVDYKKTFPKKEKEWSIAFQLEKDWDRADSKYDQSYSFPANTPNTLEQNTNQGVNDEYSMQTDYTHPFSEKIKLEVGVKTVFRTIESDFAFDRFSQETSEWIEDADRTDIFYYDQNIFAGYISSNIKVGQRTTVIGGLRYELTDLAGSFDQFEGPFSNQYSNLLPNLTLARKMGEYNQIKISYNQRIQRPNRRHINPFIEYNDNRDISFGNPTLTPELVHQVEVGSNVFIKGSMIYVSVFGRRTEDLIENLLRINEEGISESTYDNFGVRSSMGVNVFGSVSIGEKISLRGGFDVNIWELEGRYFGEALNNAGFDYNGRINATWSISKTLRAEAFSFFRSPTYTVQGKTPTWSMLSFGVKKELLNRRLTVGLNLTQPFRENRIYVSELTGNDFSQTSRTVRPVRSFGLNAGYRFGKIDFKEKTGRKKVDNSDRKEEDSGGFNQF